MPCIFCQQFCDFSIPLFYFPSFLLLCSFLLVCLALASRAQLFVVAPCPQTLWVSISISSDHLPSPLRLFHWKTWSTCLTRMM